MAARPVRGFGVLAAGLLVALGLATAFLAVALRSGWLTAGSHEPAGSNVLRLGYFPNLTHAQAVLMVDSGELARAIAPVQLVTHLYPAGPSLMEALAAGEIDVGYVGPGPVLQAYQASGGTAVRLLANAASDGVAIIARPGSGITTPQDLVGKRLATPQFGNTQDLSARHFVRKWGEEKGFASAVNFVTPLTPSEQATMMSRGGIDAAWVPEPWASRLVDQAEATVIADERSLWPDPPGHFALTVVVASPSSLATHGVAIDKLLALNAVWTARLASNRQKYVTQLNAAFANLKNSGGRPLPEKLLRSALERVTFRDTLDLETFRTMSGWAATEGWQRGPAVSLDGLARRDESR